MERKQDRVSETPAPARITLQALDLSVDVLDADQVAVSGERVLVATARGIDISGPNGCQSIDLDRQLSHLVPAGNRALALSDADDRADHCVDILSIELDGRVDTFTPRLIDVTDIAVVGGWVGCVTGLNHPGGAGVLLIDGSGEPSRLVSIPIGRGARIESSGQTFIVHDHKCRRWWRIRPGDCAVVDEGDDSTVPSDDGDVVARPNGEIDRSDSGGCGTRVSHSVGRIYQVDRGLVAQSADRRYLSIIDRQKLQTVTEYQFGDRGAQVHYDADGARLVAFDLQ